MGWGGSPQDGINAVLLVSSPALGCDKVRLVDTNCLALLVIASSFNDTCLADGEFAQV